MSTLNTAPFDQHDLIAIIYSIALLGGYHIYFYHQNVAHMHHSLASHIEFQRLSWTKCMFSDAKWKSTAFQILRTGSMVTSFYIQIALTCAASIIKPVLQDWTQPFALRSCVPLLFLFTSLIFLCLTALSFYYLNFEITLENLRNAVLPLNPRFNSEETLLSTTTLAVQNARHLRFGWRLLTIGLVGSLWSLGPWFLTVTATALTFYLYHMDFPFEAEEEKLFEIENHNDI